MPMDKIRHDILHPLSGLLFLSVDQPGAPS